MPGDLKEEAGWVGGAFGWQLVGVLIKRHNQKIIVKESGGDKRRIGAVLFAQPKLKKSE